MFTVDRSVGRLIEARLVSLRTVDDVGRFEDAMRAEFDRVDGKAIVCADWRVANVLPPAVADRLIELLARGNPRLERSAILLSAEHATFNLQVERVVREAKNSARRTFRDAPAMVAWLGESLTPAERDRVARFLSLEG
jgi:hypothetical protein